MPGLVYNSHCCLQWECLSLDVQHAGRMQEIPQLQLALALCEVFGHHVQYAGDVR
jgi:hypothetical protein